MIEKIPTGFRFDVTGIVLHFSGFYIELYVFVYETACSSFHGYNDEFHHLIYFHNGNVDMTYRDQITHVVPKTYMYFPPKHIHDETILDEHVIRYQLSFGVFKNRHSDKNCDDNKYNIMSSLESSSLFEALFIDKILEIHSNTSNPERLFEKIITELSSNMFANRYKATMLFYELFIDLYRDFNKTTENDNSRRYFPSSKLTPLILYRYLFLNAKTVTLESVSKDFVLSRRTIQRYIKKAYHTSFVNFLNEIKIEVAKELIQTTDLSITKVAQEVGYNSKTYFNKVFYNYEKKTPTEFKNEVKK